MKKMKPEKELSMKRDNKIEVVGAKKLNKPIIL